MMRFGWTGAPRWRQGATMLASLALLPAVLATPAADAAMIRNVAASSGQIVLEFDEGVSNACRMCVAGKDLRPGDYVFGWDIPHGPYEYPDGCEVFIVYMGDASHVWEKQDLLEHKNIWKPETDEGRKEWIGRSKLVGI